MKFILEKILIYYFLRHLIEIFKGKCHYLPPMSTVSNAKIAGSSFHYGGYLTGFLLWGFLIQFASIFLLGMIILILQYAIGVQIFLKILLKLVPAICVIIVKLIFNLIATRFVFLRRDTKILALDNFRFIFNFMLKISMFNIF